MSKDIIYREDAINLLWYFQDECCSAVVGDFEKLPSADRPQGEWEERPSEDWISIRRWYCSECGEWQTYGMTNYCPNCGARMKGARCHYKDVREGYLAEKADLKRAKERERRKKKRGADGKE